MNKKLICLTMSILMLLTCLLTGCSSSKKTDEGDESAVDNSAKTITMWLIAEDPVVEIKNGETAEEAAARAKEEQEKAHKAVNDAFSEITKAKFKTNVILKFCTEEEYYEKLEASIEASQEDILMAEAAAKELRKYLKAHKGEKTTEELTDDFYKAFPQYEKYRETEEDEDAPETEEETIKNQYGIIEIKYPDEKENQVDIFYIGDAVDKKGNSISGYDKYIQYYNAEWLSSLSEELGTSSKKLTDYIPPSLLNGVQIEGSVCAIPNNVPIGEYTYMFIDKEMFDKYYHKIDTVKNVMDISTFLNDVMAENGDLDPSDPNYVVPLHSTFEECIKMLCWYWDLSYTDQSVYAMHYDEERDRYYVLKKEYEIEIENEGETNTNGGASVTKKTLLTNNVLADQLYKTNDDGKYVDKDGNVLQYSFKLDNEGYWLDRGEGKTPKYETKPNNSAMYLVDENGDPVTPDTDRRVLLTAEEDGIETKMDENGNVKPSYIYSFNTEADFSILGAMMLDPATRTRGQINLGFDSLFTKRGETANYHELYATLKDYDYRGYYGTPAEGQEAAVFFQKGDARILQEYNQAMEDLAAGKKDEDGNDVKGYEWNGKTYYVVVAEYPEATESELYGNMYAVYANSPHLSRAMKVITYLNTNQELRNLLQYGIEEVHYELNDNGTVHKLSGNSEYGTYRMKMERTGNCFIATPDEDMGPDAWTYAKLQNSASLIDPLLGFDFNSATADSDYSLDIILIDRIRELNEQTLDLIDECTTKEELLALMTEGDDALMKVYSGSSQDKKFKKAINSNYDPSMPNGPEAADQTPDPDGSSPYTVYYTWLTTYGYLAGTKAN